MLHTARPDRVAEIVRQANKQIKTAAADWAKPYSGLLVIDATPVAGIVEGPGEVPEAVQAIQQNAARALRLYEGGRVVIHEGAGRVKGAVMALGWWGVAGVTVATRLRAFQSSIRSRWAGRSVVRGSRAQSSGRPSSGR
jgi:hypothetical protein